MIYYTFKFLHYPMWLLPVPAMPFVCTQVVVTYLLCDFAAVESPHPPISPPTPYPQWQVYSAHYMTT